jgi:hypothetical protein
VQVQTRSTKLRRRPMCQTSLKLSNATAALLKPPAAERKLFQPRPARSQKELLHKRSQFARMQLLVARQANMLPKTFPARHDGKPTRLPRSQPRQGPKPLRHGMAWYPTSCAQHQH